MQPTEPTPPAPQPMLMRPAARGVGYTPTVGPRLRIMLAVIFAGVALLGATGVYLAAVTFMNSLNVEKTYTTPFTFLMLVIHVGIGILFLVPFFLFGAGHFITARKRPNRAAVRRGLIVFVFGMLVGMTGLALIQLAGFPQVPTDTTSRTVIYILHVALPVLAIIVYLAHRRAGPPIRWRWGYMWGGTTAVFVLLMVLLHSVDPRDLNVSGPREGEQYFRPSAARTRNGNFIPAQTLMMDTYCQKCHADIYNDHLHSAHRFSSFNNPPYLFSVRETRAVALARDGNVKAARWCAGCHDPVPFFSGAFDDPNFDDVNHPTAQAGITCTVCHSMTKIHGTVGNANYTIEEPQHYPFAFSDNKYLQWTNNQLIKAKPDLHKRTFLKPFHKTAEFCATCHKVSLPVDLNHYKDFLRGQNHYDTFLLSGVSGHSARSFYYPPVAKTNCAECHMPLKPSGDFGSKDFDLSGTRKVHGHFFPAANTGLMHLLAQDPNRPFDAEAFRQATKVNADFLRGTDPEGKDRKLRIDIFGLKKDGSTKPEKLIAPLRPELPALKPGHTYVVEIVLRTLNVGHPFSQGTADSNEIWVDFAATSGGKQIARSGALADDAAQTGRVDEWSHFINVLMLDRDGNRVNRRNPQDIFTPLYDHQIPPGAAQVVHYRLDVPADARDSVKLRARLRYRKFDFEYLKLVQPPVLGATLAAGGLGYMQLDNLVPTLPIVDMCEDEVTLPIEGGPAVSAQVSTIPLWQRWNDYGIGCLLEGPAGARKGHFKQAEAAFRMVAQLGVKEATAHGHLNLARTYIEEGRLTEAKVQLDAATQANPPAAWWSLKWFGALVNSETATRKEHTDAVIADLESIVDPANQPRERKFDFTKDYVVLNRLANRLFRRSQSEAPGSAERRQFLLRAVSQAERVIALEAEDVEAHDLLKQCYAELSNGYTSANVRGAAASLEEFRTWGLTLADREKQRGERLAAALELIPEIDAMRTRPAQPNAPRLPIFRELIEKLSAAYHAAKDSDAELASAIARTLTGLHRESHAAYKPDENARANATRIYRESHPAANYAARDRAIYPTTPAHRQAILKGEPLEKD